MFRFPRLNNDDAADNRRRKVKSGRAMAQGDTKNPPGICGREAPARETIPLVWYTQTLFITLQPTA